MFMYAEQSLGIIWLYPREGKKSPFLSLPANLKGDTNVIDRSCISRLYKTANSYERASYYISLSFRFVYPVRKGREGKRAAQLVNFIVSLKLN